tara:strand:+ start:155 stop:1177 length:1023 start_codon:yes stop_codon:yes gene_type:complete
MAKKRNNWMGSDDATRQRFQRASELNVSDAGSDLLQDFVNRTVQQLTLREFGLQAVLPRRPGSGLQEIINQRTAGTTGGAWVNDTENGENTAEVGTYDRATFDFKTLLTQGQVTRKLQATGRSYADILALEMSAKAEDFANALEDGVCNGNAFSADSKNVNGFLTLISRSGGGTGQVVMNSATTTFGSSLVLAKLDEAIDKVKGSAQRSDLVIVGSFAGIRQLNNALQQQQQFNNVTEIAAGFRVRTYDGIPLIVSTAISNTVEINGNKEITGNSGGGPAATTLLMILNTRYAYLSELTPVTVMPLAKKSSQFDEFDMYWDGAPVLSNTLGGSLLVGLAT